jgi:amidase
MTASAAQELAFAGPIELAARIRARQLHPRELIELFAARIEALDPQLNAFRTTVIDHALVAAESPPDGPLAGVPVAIKDDTELAGQAATRGTRAPAVPQPADAEIVRRLRAAGAIPIGVTNVPELMIFPWTASDANGVTRNPWDRSRTPGGSSGGSAAAVAAGLVAAATGSDGGGSIRIPAACCGLVGMKPTRGRVSAAPAGEHWLGLSARGMLARTVADSARLLDVISGPAPGDPDPGLPRPEGGFEAAARTPPARPLQIAISRKVPPGLIAPLSRDQALAFDRTARLLAELGHEVVERHPDYGLAALQFTRSYLGGIAADFETLPAGTPTERSTRQMAAVGRRLVPAARRERVRAANARTSARLLELWREVDVLLTPGLARTALPAEGGYGRSAPYAFNLAGRFTPWTPLFNLTGQPAIALPAGTGADGLPTAIQLAAAPGQEGLLYSLAGQLEQADPWGGRIPPLARAG